ncbi:hypothetical protein [Algoriphagus namhaensis]
MESVLNYKNFFVWTDGFKMLGFILLIAGTSLLLSPMLVEVETNSRFWIVGVGSLLISLALLSSYNGVLFDLKNSRIKRYDQWFGVKFGDWEPIPRLKKIDLVVHEYKQKNTPNGVSPTFTSHHVIYKCVLLTAEKPFLVLDFRDQRKAIKFIDQLSNRLETDEQSPRLNP